MFKSVMLLVITGMLVILFCTSTSCAQCMIPQFKEAKPIWLKGRNLVMNDFAGFRAIFNLDDLTNVYLLSTGHNSYRVWVNGNFAGYGPARGPHGFYRVDLWNISPWVQKGENILAVEVIGYNVNGYGVTNQPSFFQAEVRQGENILCATGSERVPFHAFDLNYKIKKVERYSFQRAFVEAYQFNSKTLSWIKEKENSPTPVEIDIFETKALIPRGVPIPDFKLVQPDKEILHGSLNMDKPIEKAWRLPNTAPSPKYLAYSWDELDYSPVLDFQSFTVEEGMREDKAYNPNIPVNAGSYKVFDFGKNLTGFIRLQIQVEQPTKVFLSFDEILRGNLVDWKRLGCHNVIALNFVEKGYYEFESIEPYTFRYLQISSTVGDCVIKSCAIRLYEEPESSKAKFECSDERINRIFEAGRATFAQNAVDIFMDCPHRERAGWLCDSFFTARSALVLCGSTSIEHNFFENFMLPQKFEFLPEGMLPMCYPADHNDGVFIPNWAMWFVIQLGEYVRRSNDWDLVSALKPKVLALLKFFEQYKNSDGLLEKLPSWVFVEWSKANDFVQDVNYPSNMLFAGVLDTTSELYNIPELKQEAERIRETIRQQSFDGKFFVDNAVRKNGNLTVTENKTEVCQYFAFFFKVATPETYPELWKILTTDFGPHRKENNKYPEVHLANSFIGNVLRAELLTIYGESQKVIDESIGYLDYMATTTGTLWENVHDHASLNHGFASHIVYIYYRTALGVREIDPIQKSIKIAFQPVNLNFCSGEIPLIGTQEKLVVKWRKEGNKLHYTLKVPKPYTAKIENNTPWELIEEQ